MPAKGHSLYLRNVYQRNLLKEPGGIELAGEPIESAPGSDVRQGALQDG